MIKGDERRKHLATIRKEILCEMRDISHKHALQLSYGEVYGETLAAIEELANGSAEVIRRTGEICRDEYCTPGGGSFENIRERLKEIRG
jgi:hypothetical protein